MKKLLFIMLVLIAGCDNPNSETVKNDENKSIGIGQVLKTEYFDVTVNSAKFYKSVKAQEGLIDLPADSAIRYLLINVTFKNTNTESRTLFEGGPILINYNGKEYSYDEPEPTMAEGWGIFMDAINPMLTKTTYLVYKIPREIKGDVFWRPNRADDDQKILLLNAK
ncbi:MAG: DUF4352 domain-containing protein [Bacteroidota bacterium]